MVAHSTFDTSMNYRAAVVYGTLHPVTDPKDERTSLSRVSDSSCPAGTTRSAR